MPRWLSLFLVLLAFPGWAAEPCRSDACSDDPDGVLGNEELVWDASPGAERYEVALASTGEVCATVAGSTSYTISGTPCDEVNDGLGFTVRACNSTGCSSWSEEVVEILPYSCLEARDWDPCLYHDENGECEGGHRIQCEKPCYQWQDGTNWRRLSERWEECP